MNYFAKFRKAIPCSQKIVKNHENCNFFQLEASYKYFDVILNQVPESKLIPDPELVPELVLHPELVPDSEPDPDPEPEPDPKPIFPISDLRIRILPELIPDPKLVPDPKSVLDPEPIPDPGLVSNLVPDPGPYFPQLI
jgi:hypothetical protein